MVIEEKFFVGFRQIFRFVYDAKRRLAVILLIVLANVPGFLRWQRHSDPRFALDQAAKAIRTHDLALFETHVDVEKVSGSYFDQQLLPAKLGAPSFEATRARDVQALTRRLRRWLETSLIDEEELPRLALLGDTLTGAFAPTGRAEVLRLTPVGNTAFAFVRVEDARGCGANLDLKLVRQAGTWRISEVTNVKNVVRNLQDSENARVEKIQRAINAAVVVSRAGRVASDQALFLYQTTFTTLDARRVWYTTACDWKTGSTTEARVLHFRGRRTVSVTFSCPCEGECVATVHIDAVERPNGKTVRRENARLLQ